MVALYRRCRLAQVRRRWPSPGAGRMPKAVVAVVVVVDRRDGGGGPAPDVRIRGEAHQRPRCAHGAEGAAERESREYAMRASRPRNLSEE